MSSLRKKSRNTLIRQHRAVEKAIKLKCFDCMQSKRCDCEIKECPLYKYRPWSNHALTRNKSIHPDIEIKKEV